MEDAYARFVSEVLDFFEVDPAKGLGDSQVARHARLYGKNEERTSFWKTVLKQFDDLLVKILIAAAVVSFVLALVNGETGLVAFLEPSLMWGLPPLRDSFGDLFILIVVQSYHTASWVIPPWSNLWLVGSIILTMLLHLLILYVHPLAVLFSVAPLSWAEWTVVFSVLYMMCRVCTRTRGGKVIIIDEVLKFFFRRSLGTRLNFQLRRVDRLPKRELRGK